MLLSNEEAPALSTNAPSSTPLKAWKFLEASAWIQKCFSRYPAMVVADDLGTCYASCGAVILSALAIGTESAVILAGVTSYPAPFVAAVCAKMKSKKSLA